jgi:hypothetical protein
MLLVQLEVAILERKNYVWSTDIKQIDCWCFDWANKRIDYFCTAWVALHTHLFYLLNGCIVLAPYVYCGWVLNNFPCWLGWGEAISNLIWCLSSIREIPFLISNEQVGMSWNGTITKISWFNISFEDLTELPSIEWWLSTGDIVPNDHQLYQLFDPVYYHSHFVNEIVPFNLIYTMKYQSFSRRSLTR